MGNSDRYAAAHKISIHPMLRFNKESAVEASLPSLFQYILCYGSTEVKNEIRNRYPKISIHPMLRFNSKLNNKFTLILYFNTSYVTVQHLRVSHISFLITFQYILCYGSTELKFQDQFQPKKISIHPMLRFNLGA